MKESYGEDLASHSGLDPYADDGNVVGVASARGTGRPAIELRNHPFRVPTLWCLREGNTHVRAIGEWTCGTAESQNLRMPENSKRENREIPLASESFDSGRSENASGGTADMHADGKSDGPIVPAKRANKAGTPVAESVEERGSPKGNATQFVLLPDTAPGRTLSRDVREATMRALRQVEMLAS